jgi:two-component system NarL family sensor kinase
LSRDGSAHPDPEREAKLLSRVIDTISAGLDLDRILQGIARLVTETTDTDVCFVHLLDEPGTRLQLRGATPPFDGLVGKIELSLGEGVSGWVALHGEPAVLVDRKADDPRYRYFPALRGEDYASMVSVPVVTPLGHLVGVLNVHTKARREFTEPDVELLRPGRSRTPGCTAGSPSGRKRWSGSPSRWWSGRNTRAGAWPARSTTASASAS